MWKLLSSTAIVLALSSPAWAQTTDGAGSGTTMNLEERSEAVGLEGQYEVDRSNYPFLGEMREGAWSSQSLIGRDLTTTDGEVIGEIEGVIFTPDDRIAGLVVDAGDYMGVESRPVVVDWYAVGVSPTDQTLTADLSQEQLQTAPEQEEDQFVEFWRNEKAAEVPDIAESQPGVITGEDVQSGEDAPGAGAGSTDGGGQTGGGGAAD